MNRNRRLRGMIGAVAGCIMLILPSGSWGAKFLSPEWIVRTRIFYTETDRVGWDAVFKGEIMSLGARPDAQKNTLMRVTQDKSKATVRLYTSEGIKPGDTLYVVNERNLIISKCVVHALFRSQSFGYLCIAYGNLRLSAPGLKVAVRALDEESKYAVVYRSRGDYHAELGNIGEAIQHYKRAIEVDPGNPEAHLALGSLYLNKGLYQFAIKEFDLAHKQIGRMYDREDRFLLLSAMAEVRYLALSGHRISGELRSQYKNEGIAASREALKIYPRSKAVNFYLAMFYFMGPSPLDVEAKNQFLAVIEMDPERADAYANLAYLYRKHGNQAKAEQYARKAVQIDPSNKRARDILNLASDDE